MVSQDRRRHPRINFVTKVKYVLSEVEQYYYSRDVSLGGIFLETKKPFTVGTKLDLDFPIPDSETRARVTGEVVRVIKPDLDDRDLDFMSVDHHRVRNFCVTELPRAGKPLTPEYIAQALGLPVERVVPMLDELERHMTFLFRNAEGAVTWAYPVTVDVTPHRVTFSTGEQVYAA